MLQLIHFFEKCDCMAMSTLAAPTAAIDAVSTIKAQTATIAEEDVVVTGMEAQKQTEVETNDGVASAWLDPAACIVLWFELVCLLATRGIAFQLHYGIDRMNPIEELRRSLFSYDFSTSFSAVVWYALALGRYALVYWCDATFPLLSPSASAACGIYSASSGSGGGVDHHQQNLLQRCAHYPAGFAGSTGSDHQTHQGSTECDGHGAAQLVLRPYQATEIVTILVGCSTACALQPLVIGFLRNRDPHWQENDYRDRRLNETMEMGGMALMFVIVVIGMTSSVEEPTQASDLNTC